MSFRSQFARPTPYLVWMALSSLALLVGEQLDPYALGATAFACAGVSAGLFLVAVFCGPRAIALAVLAGLPTVGAFWLLSTYRWA